MAPLGRTRPSDPGGILFPLPGTTLLDPPGDFRICSEVFTLSFPGMANPRNKRSNLRLAHL